MDFGPICIILKLLAGVETHSRSTTPLFLHSFKFARVPRACALFPEHVAMYPSLVDTLCKVPLAATVAGLPPSWIRCFVDFVLGVTPCCNANYARFAAAQAEAGWHWNNKVKVNNMLSQTLYTSYSEGPLLGHPVNKIKLLIIMFLTGSSVTWLRGWRTSGRSTWWTTSSCKKWACRKHGRNRWTDAFSW